MASGNHIPVVHAAQAEIYYLPDASSTDFSGSLAALVSSATQVIQCKNNTVTNSKTESEQVPLLGVESTTAGTGTLNTGTFQNAFQDFKNTSNAEMSGTLILTLANDGSAADMPDFIELATGDGQAISTTHHRHTFGDSTNNQAQVLNGAIFLVFDSGATGGVACMLNPTVNLGDIKPTGVEGHFEIDFDANTLPKNYALEITDLD